MTYLEFLAVFLLPPIAVLLLLGRRRLSRGLAWQLLAIVAVALVYTAPWDGGLIANGVWSYPAAQVAGPSLLRVPFEEFGFYALQTVMTGLFTALLWRRLAREG